MKYGFIVGQQREFPIRTPCRALKVSPIGFYEWRNRRPSPRARVNFALLGEIRRMHSEYQEAYGAFKTWRELNRQGIVCGKHRIARLRQAAGIEARRKRRFRVVTEHHRTAAPAPDLLQREFRAATPDAVWVGDMTFIRTRQGWLHLAVLLDLYSRRVVGWAMDPHPGKH